MFPIEPFPFFHLKNHPSGYIPTQLLGIRSAGGFLRTSKCSKMRGSSKRLPRPHSLLVGGWTYGQRSRCFTYICIYIYAYLVGGWTNPIEKYSSKWEGWESSPSRGENKTYLKPPPRYSPNGGFLKCWYPTSMGFPTKNDHFGAFWENPPFKETPKWWWNMVMNPLVESVKNHQLNNST